MNTYFVELSPTKVLMKLFGPDILQFYTFEIHVSDLLYELSVFFTHLPTAQYDATLKI